MVNKISKAIVAFVPVLHKGYVDFFSQYEGDILIFSKKLIDEYVHLTRDLRTLDPEYMVKILQTIFLGREVKQVDPEIFKSWKYNLTYLPEDEVSQSLVDKYLSQNKIQYIPVFLRWNKTISFQEHIIDPKRKITTEVFHREIMKEAFRESEKSADWWRQIGGIIVKDGMIVLTGHNHHLPTDFHLVVNGDPRSNFDAGQHQNIFTSIHAEAELIARAAKEGINLSGASIYTTTFPCPNCARLIGTAGIKHVYYSKGYSLLDAEKILDHFGIEVVLVQ